jgi:hypothetical protein
MKKFHAKKRSGLNVSSLCGFGALALGKQKITCIRCLKILGKK